LPLGDERRMDRAVRERLAQGLLRWPNVDADAPAVAGVVAGAMSRSAQLAIETP